MAGAQRGGEFLSWGKTDVLQGRGKWVLQNQSQSQHGFHQRLLLKMWGAPYAEYGPPRGHPRDLKARVGLREQVGVADGMLGFLPAGASECDWRSNQDPPFDLGPDEAGTWLLPEKKSGAATEPHATGYSLIYPAAPEGTQKGWELHWVRGGITTENVVKRLSWPDDPFAWWETAIALYNGSLTLYSPDEPKSRGQVLRAGDYVRFRAFESSSAQLNPRPLLPLRYDGTSNLLALVLFFSE